MKRWWWILPVLLLGVAVADAEAARAPMVNFYSCALAADGTGCIGDHPLAGGACDTGTCTALAAGDKAVLITTTCSAFYTYTTGTAATTTGACPSIIRPPDYSSAGNWVRTAVTDSVGTASDSAAGIAELATDAETVTGTATNRVTTPANLTARLAAPGAIGGTTPAAGTFTLLTVATSFGFDVDGNLTAKSLTIPKISGQAGLTCVYEANSTDTSQVCWQGPDSRSADLKLKFPDADPATSILVCGAPSSTVSTCAWYAMDTDLSSVSASDDTVPSAKAVKAVTDARLSTTAPAAIDGSGGTGPTAAQMADPRCQVSNYGQAASDVAVALPTVAENLSCLFVVGTAQTNKWGVRAATNDKIYLLAADGTISAGSDNGYARMTNAQVGQSFACWSFKTGSSSFDWQCKAIAIGTSTFAAN